VTHLREQVERDGFALLSEPLDDSIVNRLVAALGTCASAGRRNVAREVPEVGALAASGALHEPARAILGREAFVVRVLLFDKTPGANWAVGWHQDPAIAVRERREVEGFTGWSVKAGVPHVHPPAEVLAGMLALRVHLDACPAENGALRVLPGTHRHGRLSDEAAEQKRLEVEEVVCESPRGGILAIRPLLLHASSQATTPAHRRVLHFEFACEELPGGLEWFERIHASGRPRMDTN
jgi:ectoine hydroxylase-related dioxygenase (phytanoyl-CoA dioxygenase family)